MTISKKQIFPLRKYLEYSQEIKTIDDSVNSSKYFNLSNVKYIYGLGRHALTIKGSKQLRHYSTIDYEMYDSYGTSIECLPQSNNITVGASNVLFSFRIKDYHENGDSTLVFAGSSIENKNNPPQKDVLWKLPLTIDKYKNNDDNLVFVSNPSFSFTETANGIVNEFGQEVTILNFNFSKLEPFAGRVDGIAVYTRLSNTSNDFGLSTIYRLRPNISESVSYIDPNLIDYVQYATSSQITDEVNDSTVSFSIPLTIITKPTYYDIKVNFYDGGEQLCKNDNGKILSIYNNNVPLEGVTNTSQLKYDNVLGCVNVKWANSPIVGNESGILGTNSSIVELTWDDIKFFNQSQFPLSTHDIYGVSRSVTYIEAINIQKYAVWMFLTSESSYSPEWQFPGKVLLYNMGLFNQSLFNEKVFPSPDGKGMWYFKGFFSTNYASIEVPRGMTVSFWAGFVNRKTQLPTLTYFTPRSNQQ